MSDHSTNSHVVSGLIKKKAELLGKIDYHKNEARKLSETITHLDATMKAFDPDFKVNSIEAKEHRKKNILFEHGELSRLVLGVLREAKKPLTTNQVCDAIKEIKNIQVNISDTVKSTLKLQVKNGNISKDIKEGIAIWFIT